MYAKIYKELFIKNYTLKKKIRDNVWAVKIYNENYYVYVYEDTEYVEDFGNYNEAELLKYKFSTNIELRINKNREFYENIRKFKREYSYLFKNKENNQKSLFTYDNYCM